jgi:signal transduction histidine kinase
LCEHRRTVSRTPPEPEDPRSHALSPGELRQLAAEQSALRRVATLVAGGAGARELFAATAAEVGQVLGAAGAGVGRYDGDDLVMVGGWRADGGDPGTFDLRMALDGDSVAARVRRTGRPARMDSYADVPGEIAQFMREEWQEFTETIGAPITVGGHLWGVVVITTPRGRHFGPETDERLASFTELIAIAVSNAAGAEQLAASRARIVTAGDAARRRIQRDLHDGAQQRLVALTLRLRAAAHEHPGAAPELTAVADAIESIHAELQELSRGLHPAVLTLGGLEAALRQAAGRSAVPVTLELALDGPPPDTVAIAAYYVTCEALTNVAKYGEASAVELSARTDGDALVLRVRDDGVGGADPTRGSGLIGLQDRVEALGGTLTVDSPPGAGTTLTARLPLPASQASGVSAHPPSPGPASSPS